MVSLRISRCSLMASLSHFPNPFSLSSHRLFALPLPSIYTDHTLLHIYNHRHRHPAISASSNKKPRRVRSNADICNDIREFLSAAGLPEGHVPSMKELSQHGRQDLANIVRRRGYKLIKELLATSTKSDTKEGLIEKQDISSEYEYDSTEGPDTISERPDEMVEDMTEGVPSSSEVFVKQNDSNSANGENIDYAFSSDSKSCMAVESSTNSSWQEKVAKFIKNGELDAIEDDGFGILNEIGTNDGEGFVELDATKELSSLGEEHSEWVLGRSDTAKILNPSISPSKQIVLPAPGNNSPRDGYFSNDGLLNGDYEEDLDVETRKQENQIEANHLKFMLHQKELELSRLKEQIEKEKHALSILQAKAETEISKAQKLITEKDAELHAAEESLSGLEEVQIQYCGDGETVEVAGSFNGWHHPITMDPQPSSIVDPLGSRKSRLWTTVLWLYPGIYEIKFIIDGHWRIDPQRESVTRGTIQNNILRVDR